VFLEDQEHFDNMMGDFRQANWQVFLGLKAKVVSHLERIKVLFFSHPCEPNNILFCGLCSNL
jgi:hypothetical protein